MGSNQPTNKQTNPFPTLQIPTLWTYRLWSWYSTFQTLTFKRRLMQKIPGELPTLIPEIARCFSINPYILQPIIFGIYVQFWWWIQYKS